MTKVKEITMLKEITRMDLAERDLFEQLLRLGHPMLAALIAAAGEGDEASPKVPAEMIKDRMEGTGMPSKIRGAQAMLWTRSLFLCDARSVSPCDDTG